MSRIPVRPGEIRVVSAPLDPSADNMLLERAGVRVLILRDSLTIREALARASDRLGIDIRRLDTAAHIC